ncbi:flagellar hook protein FlgE [Pseudoduganella sp. GCM10020061]|uniref:flagellar hook protein FlgE n=1 Tax=Pseudoduganella sp. GCM10020061 TaxID=3317345 RepID=UPI0036315221
MSFQQGLSGLNGAAKSLDVIGNNIANASTVGFKGSQAQFADVYANSLNGTSGNQAGIGSKVSLIAQQFTQGNIESSNNPLDIAINGGGFFRTSLNGAIQYTRNGQFSMDKQGYIVNAQGATLTGYMADNGGQILAGTPQPLRIDTADLPPRVTSLVTTGINLDSRSTVPVNTPFDASNPETYNKQVPIDVYDTLGNAHTLSVFYVKAGPSQWDVYVASDGVERQMQAAAAAASDDSTALGAAALAARNAVPFNATNYANAAAAAVNAVASANGAPASLAAIVSAAATTEAGVVGTNADQIDAAIAASLSSVPPSQTIPASRVGRLVFNESGTLSALTTPAMPFTVSMPLFPATGADPIALELDFTGSTQFGSTTAVNRITQDGYTAGQLTRFTAGADGVVLGQYSNGQSQALGQIVLANFANPNGLTPLGNNAWSETSASGTALVGSPNSGSFGVLQSSAVENSNVDLTAELVSMITAQRVYQANAQTIKTQDSVLQTLVNLR